MDGKVSMPGRIVLSRKFVQPYPLPSLPPILEYRARTERKFAQP